MRIVQVNSVCGVGSTGRLAVDIQNELANVGHEGYVFYGRGPMSPDSSHVYIGNRLTTYVHVAITRLFDRHGFGSTRATISLVKRIDALNPDLIHLHNIHGYYVNIDVLFSYLRKAGKPIIWTLHDCWAFTGHCCNFCHVSCNRWRTGCFACPQRTSYPSSILVDNSEQNYRRKKELFSGLDGMTIVTPSNWLAGLVADSFLSEYPVRVINNGIDVGRFRPAMNDFRELHGIGNRFVILGVASVWSGRKGLEYLIELSRRFGEYAVVVVAGLTKSQKKQLPEGMIGIEKTHSVDELVSIYSAADVFVNPTLEDNFPTTNLEALACGTPVVTFDSGGSSESVDMSCGVAVRRGDLEELVCAIRAVIEKGKANYSAQCRSRAIERFDKRLMVKRYLKLYSGHA